MIRNKTMNRYDLTSIKDMSMKEQNKNLTHRSNVEMPKFSKSLSNY